MPEPSAQVSILVDHNNRTHGLRRAALVSDLHEIETTTAYGAAAATRSAMNVGPISKFLFRYERELTFRNR